MLTCNVFRQIHYFENPIVVIIVVKTNLLIGANFYFVFQEYHLFLPMFFYLFLCINEDQFKTPPFWNG